MTAETEWAAREEKRYGAAFDRPGWKKRSEWPPGPWDGEPDRVEWRYHETPRFPLLIVRNGAGGLCGYVGVPPGHPWHGKDYGELDSHPDVHGGLTFAAPCDTRVDAKICHVARSGETDDVWWLGFDCVHCYDVAPEHLAFDREYGLGLMMGKSYKDIAYVRHETLKLAAQAARVAKGLSLIEED